MPHIGRARQTLSVTGEAVQPGLRPASDVARQADAARGRVPAGWRQVWCASGVGEHGAAAGRQLQRHRLQGVAVVSTMQINVGALVKQRLHYLLVAIL